MDAPPELRCPSCDYDLRGKPQGRCSECGLAFKVEAVRDDDAVQPGPKPGHARRILRAYATGGFVLGFGWLLLVPFTLGLGLSRGFAIGVSGILLVPVYLIVLSVLYPRLHVSLVGLLLLLTTWSAGYVLAVTVIEGELDPGRAAVGLVWLGMFMTPAYALVIYITLFFATLGRGRRRPR